MLHIDSDNIKTQHSIAGNDRDCQHLWLYQELFSKGLGDLAGCGDLDNGSYTKSQRLVVKDFRRIIKNLGSFQCRDAS